MPFGYSHQLILGIARKTVNSFFSQIEVLNAENVPKDGPVIVACNHHNMIVDPAMLSSSFPHGRYIHYWAKSTLFKNPIAKIVLDDAGNIAVARGAKDNQELYGGTFKVLALGEVVAVFPEGTSYTESRIMQVKDGVSWSALEYIKWARSSEGVKANAKDVVVLPVGIVYTNKSKYRSSVVVKFGTPIPMKKYEQDFLSGEEGAAKSAVKKLTRDIGNQMVELTVNAPDWDTLYAAKMARDLLWNDPRRINLSDFTEVYQTLVDLFTIQDEKTYPGVAQARKNLLRYNALLKSSRLTNSAVCDLPLPRTLDPSRPIPLKTRFGALFLLVRDTIALLVRLPFFVIPLTLHIPAYIMANYGARMVEEWEEEQAQYKIIFGLLVVPAAYFTLFLFLWALFWLTPLGAAAAACIVGLFANYYLTMIDDTYDSATRLLAAWRLLIGVWGPKRWDMSVSALIDYATIQPPPPNPWIKKPNKVSQDTKEADPTLAQTSSAEPEKKRRRVKAPSRRLIRHVLRARVAAAESLGQFLREVEKSGADVPASLHLAQSYSPTATPDSPALMPASEGVEVYDGPQGKRNGREVIRFLRSRGAKIEELKEKQPGGWALSETDGEGMLSPRSDSE
jgi:1-acyl-sn-glycerol-3-phosphate acyltransferase